MTHRFVSVGLLCLLLIGGCKKNSEPSPAQLSKLEAKTFYSPILTHLSKAGFKVGEFEQTAAKPFMAKSCFQGEVDQLDVILCKYEDEQTTRTNEKAFDQFLGSATTGVARSKGSIVLAIADRKKHDLQGKQINKLLQTFLKEVRLP